MSTDTEKRSPEQIVESALDGLPGIALNILGIQNEAGALVEQFSDLNNGDYPVMWDVVDYHCIPREFFELLQKIADYEVRL